MKKYRVCILGSGLMSRSVIDFFCRNLDTDDRYKVTVGNAVAFLTEFITLSFKFFN